MKKILVYLFAIVLTTITFTSCNNNEPSNNPMKNTTWVANPEIDFEETFVFGATTFTLTEALISTGESVSGGGSYKYEEGIITLTFNSIGNNSIDVSKMPTTATVNGNKLTYAGMVFTKK